MSDKGSIKRREHNYNPVGSNFLNKTYFVTWESIFLNKEVWHFYRSLLTQVIYKHIREQNVDLYMTFVDLTKAFDTVSREGLWKIMAKFGCPAKFIAMVRQFHDGMLARVQNDGEFSDPFPVRNGVKQGCVLASTLFSMMFSAMLTDAFRDGDNGIPIRYRFDGKLFNLRRLQAKSKVQTEVLDEFLFADDMERECKKVWIKYLIYVIAMISQSASKRLK